MIMERCPICQKIMAGQSTAEWPQFPFCSPRCKLVDLGRWLGEEYRVEAEKTEEVAPGNDTLEEPP
jgi:endogenous inhibitor of DNA gyrase (YacG/DUF329 family)